MTDPTPDALQLLETDHEEIRRLLREYRELAAGHAPAGRRKALAEQIGLALAIHARLEDELLYPAVRDATGDHGLMDEAEGEHAATRDLVAQLLAMDPGDDAVYDARLAVLAEQAEHHMRAEQDRMFPRVRHCGIDLVRMGERLRERRRELDAVREALHEDLLASVLA